MFKFRPSMEWLETRENPSGPDLVDPNAPPPPVVPPAQTPPPPAPGDNNVPPTGPNQ